MNHIRIDLIFNHDNTVLRVSQGDKTKEAITTPKAKLANLLSVAEVLVEEEFEAKYTGKK